MPEDHRYVNKFLMECNYLQAMEGDYDPGHGPFLHTVLDGGPQVPQFNVVQAQSRNRPTPENEPFPKAVGPRRQTESNTKCLSVYVCLIARFRGSFSWLALLSASLDFPDGSISSL
jgi:hypothetical protein